MALTILTIHQLILLKHQKSRVTPKHGGLNSVDVDQRSSNQKFPTLKGQKRKATVGIEPWTFLITKTTVLIWQVLPQLAELTQLLHTVVRSQSKNLFRNIIRTQLHSSKPVSFPATKSSMFFSPTCSYPLDQSRSLEGDCFLTDTTGIDRISMDNKIVSGSRP